MVTASGVSDYVSKLDVSKLDTAGSYIEGAQLSVHEFDPAKADGIGELALSLSWTTDRKAKEIHKILNVDTPYVLVEDQAPDGYSKAEPIYFSIGKYDSSITCYTMTNGSLTANDSLTARYTNGSELIMVDVPVNVKVNKTEKVVPNVKTIRQDDKVVTLTGVPAEEKHVTLSSIVRSVQTGDTTPVAVLAVIVIAAAAVLAFLLFRKKKADR